MTPPTPEGRPPQAAPPIVAAPDTAPGIVRKLLDVQQREREALLSEFVKIRGLMPLLMKHRNGDAWSRAERAELQGQLRALAHLSPYLFILLLPGSFVLLPVYAWWLDRRRSRGGDTASGTCRRRHKQT